MHAAFFAPWCYLNEVPPNWPSFPFFVLEFELRWLVAFALHLCSRFRFSLDLLGRLSPLAACRQRISVGGAVRLFDT